MSNRDLIKVCPNCKKLIDKPKKFKYEREICGKCEELVEQYDREHQEKGGK